MRQLNPGITNAVLGIDAALTEFARPSRNLIDELISAKAFEAQFRGLNVADSLAANLLRQSESYDPLNGAFARDLARSATQFDRTNVLGLTEGAAESIARTLGDGGWFEKLKEQAVGSIAPSDVRAFTLELQQHRNAVSSFAQIAGGLERWGGDAITTTLAMRLAADERDLFSAVRRLELQAQAPWLENIRPYALELETLVQSIRLGPAMDAGIFDQASALFGPFDRMAQSALEHARTANERLEGYRDLGADMRLFAVPRKVVRRKLRALARVPERTGRMAPTPIERSLRRTPLADEVVGAFRLCAKALSELRHDLDLGMTNRYGSEWIAERVPHEMFSVWRATAKRNGLSPKTPSAWLEQADEEHLVELIEAHWESLYAYRIGNRTAFVGCVHTVALLRRQVSRAPAAVNPFDALRLSIAVNELLAALRTRSI